jgi:phosphatidylglycerophosphatase A
MSLLLEFFIGSWETIAILAVLLVLFGAKHLGDLPRDPGLERFWSDRRNSTRGGLPFKHAVLLLLATGAGLGGIPFAPGTFGSLGGLALTVALLGVGNFWFYLVLLLLLVWASALLCDAAEKILRQKDPASIVLDEIVAVPCCFVTWLAVYTAEQGAMPSPDYFVGPGIWPLTLGVFVAFRVFDVAKPWPIRRSQSLPGGWGVVLDDLLAAAGVNALVLVVWGATRLLDG